MRGERTGIWRIVTAMSLLEHANLTHRVRFGDYSVEGSLLSLLDMWALGSVDVIYRPPMTSFSRVAAAFRRTPVVDLVAIESNCSLSALAAGHTTGRNQGRDDADELDNACHPLTDV